jgi:hypothetical protein
LKEKVANLDRFLPLSKDSIRDLFTHFHHLSTTNITNNVGVEQLFDPEFEREVESFIQEIDPEDFDFDDANTRLDH